MMNGAAALLALAGAMVAGPTSLPAKGPQALTAAEEAQLVDTINRGQLLYRYDQAAWHTTDAMVEHVPQAQLPLIRGWVVTDAPNGSKASYFGRDGDRPFLIYSAVWNGAKVLDEVVAEPARRPPLAPDEQRLAAALGVAWPAAEKLGHCNDKRFNVVVLPGASASDPISVYFLTPQVENYKYPFGGHYRLDVQNGAVVRQRQFTNSCIVLDTRPPAGPAPVGLGITHLLDPIPTEIHVFSAFGIGMPLFVATRTRIFRIDASGGQAQIKVIDQSQTTALIDRRKSL